MQNYFDTGPSKTIMRNTTYKVFFRHTDEAGMLRNIGANITPNQVLKFYKL
jgi:hypothetical protein